MHLQKEDYKKIQKIRERIQILTEDIGDLNKNTEYQFSEEFLCTTMDKLDTTLSSFDKFLD